jgi:hypothetical protein
MGKGHGEPFMRVPAWWATRFRLANGFAEHLAWPTGPLTRKAAASLELRSRPLLFSLKK